MKKELEAAFARPHSQDAEYIHHAQPGMTLRDYFAASALQGLIADTSCNGTPEDFAIKSFEMADAMMKAREA